jgi:hypothetical protein
MDDFPYAIYGRGKIGKKYLVNGGLKDLPRYFQGSSVILISNESHSAPGLRPGLFPGKMLQHPTVGYAFILLVC